VAIRCKMQLENVFASTYNGAKAVFRCTYDPQLIAEDLEFSKATPTGMAEFQVSNPVAAKQLVIGAFYYVDFTPVAVPAK
jgi:hypothetical protein